MLVFCRVHAIAVSTACTNAHERGSMTSQWIRICLYRRLVTCSLLCKLGACTRGACGELLLNLHDS